MRDGTITYACDHGAWPATPVALPLLDLHLRDHEECRERFVAAVRQVTEPLLRWLSTHHTP